MGKAEFVAPWARFDMEARADFDTLDARGMTWRLPGHPKIGPALVGVLICWHLTRQISTSVASRGCLLVAHFVEGRGSPRVGQNI